MIMRVSWGKIQPGMWDRFEQLWKESVAKLAGTPGLKAHWLLKDPDHACAGHSFSLWDSVEEMDAAPEMRDLTPAIVECFTGQYLLSVCEVRGSDVTGLMRG